MVSILAQKLNILNLSQESLEINGEKVNKFLSFGARSLFKDNQSFYRNIFLLKNSENLIFYINLNLKKKNTGIQIQKLILK